MRGTLSPRMAAKRTSSRRPSMHDTLSAARGMFEFVEAPEPLPQALSPYDTEGFKQGATIIPHVLAVIASQTNASRKHPWNGVSSQKGLVPTKWVRPMHTSPDLLPYMAIRKPPHAIIPVDRDGQTHRDPGRDCSFWTELDEIYDAHRGRGKQTPRTLIQRFTSPPIYPTNH